MRRLILFERVFAKCLLSSSFCVSRNVVQGFSTPEQVGRCSSVSRAVVDVDTNKYLAVVPEKKSLPKNPSPFLSH